MSIFLMLKYKQHVHGASYGKTEYIHCNDCHHMRRSFVLGFTNTLFVLRFDVLEGGVWLTIIVLLSVDF